MSPLRLRRSVPALALCLAAVAAAGLAVPSSATAAATRPVTHHRMVANRHDVARISRGPLVTLARGVTMRHLLMYSDGSPEQVMLLRVDLTVPGVGIDAASPNGMIGAQRSTVRAQTNARHAIAGVNADFFDLDNPSSAPRGTVVTSGQMLKSPTIDRNANFMIYKNRAGRARASIGALNFSGTVVRVRKGSRDSTRNLGSVNSLTNAGYGNISLLTASLAPSQLEQACTLVTGSLVHGVRTVRSVRASVYSTPRFSSRSWGLLACAGGGGSWLQSLRPGDEIIVSDGIAGGTPWAAISGGSVLVRNGRAWTDPYGEHLAYTGQNAETFFCVARNGTSVTIGTIDGYTYQSAGVTYNELTRYMLAMGGCWSGVVVDGGGSTTMVAKLPGASSATVQNVPADDPPRQVSDTVVVFG